MRNQISKLKKGHSTKAERKFSELLKDLRIKFQTKVIIGGREVDFLIGKTVIEIDGHKQDSAKNRLLITLGYEPIHLNNWEIDSTLKEWIKKLNVRNKLIRSLRSDSPDRPGG